MIRRTINFDTGSTDICSYNPPCQCPSCNVSLMPTELYCAGLSQHTAESLLVFVYFCPSCKKPFLAVYHKLPESPYERYTPLFVVPQNFKEAQFDKLIKEISPEFIEIYNEAAKAESEGLMKICGMGYRKALEFLIKDYLISLIPDKAEDIKPEMLSASIKRISNERLKNVATKSAWLGNDQTHYVQKY